MATNSQMNNKPQHCILHIGYGKTGTSSIQHMLANNREILRSGGIVYPDLKIGGGWLYMQNHNIVGRTLAGRKGWWGINLDEMFQQFFQQCAAAKCNTLLLSAESFLGGVQPWDHTTSNDYYHAVSDTLDKLQEKLEGVNVTIMVYLRRQDYWLESAINQNIKFAGLMGPAFGNPSPEETAKIYAPRLDYATVLDLWASRFGENSIKVGIYEKGRSGDDITKDFLIRLDLLHLSIQPPPVNSSSQNIRLDMDVLRFKQILNKISRPKYEERVLVEALRKVSAEIEPSRDKWLLSGNFRRLLLERYATSNEKVSRRFLGDEDGVLFRESWPDPEDNSHNAQLPAERILEILLRLQRHQQSCGYRIALFRHQIAEVLRKKFPLLHGAARYMSHKVSHSRVA